MKKEIILSGIIILLAIVIIGILFVKPAIQDKIQEKINQRYSQGVLDAVLAIMNQASQCQIVPLTYGDSTLNIVAVNCLEGGE